MPAEMSKTAFATELDMVEMLLRPVVDAIAHL